jgi:hypothetical protein
LEGVGVGVDDFLFVVAVFFRCGVGVGVAKIFLSVSPNDGSAASLVEAATTIAVRKIKVRRSIYYLVGRKMFAIP